MNDDEGVREGWQDQVEYDDGAGFKKEQQKGRTDDGEAEACDSPWVKAERKTAMAEARVVRLTTGKPPAWKPPCNCSPG